MTSAQLTDRQRSALRALARLMRRGYPPTLKELAYDLDIAAAPVDRLLAILEKKGYIRREYKVQRGLSLTAKGRHELGLPPKEQTFEYFTRRDCACGVAMFCTGRCVECRGAA